MDGSEGFFDRFSGPLRLHSGRLKTGLLSTWLLAAATAQADEFAPYAFRMGEGIQLIPQLISQQIYDSNVSGEVGASNDGWLTLLEPRLRIQARPRLNQYQLDLMTRHGNYRGETPREDFTDLSLHFSSFRQQNGNLEFGLNYRFDRVRDYQNPISGAHYDLDWHFQQHFMSAELRSGAYFSPLKLDLKTQGYIFGWESDRSQTRKDDHQVFRTDLNSAYAAHATTDWLFRGQMILAGLPNNPANDGQSLHLLSGIAWKPLEPAEGQLLLGAGRVAPRNGSDVAITQRPLWQALLSWEVEEQTRISVEAERRFRLPLLAPEWQLDTLYCLKWQQQWSSRYDSTFHLGYLEQEGMQQSEEHSEPGHFFLNLELNYDFSRWLRLGAGYHYGSQALGDVEQRFERHRLLVSAQLGF